MLSTAENEMLTRVGPGTPCGELMRRYWHPIAATVQLEDNPVRKVRILGEDLVLFRDRGGNLGLIAPRCPHRAMHMAFGIPEEVGLRCPYHGWLFDGTGRCLEQPLAPPDQHLQGQGPDHRVPGARDGRPRLGLSGAGAGSPFTPAGPL